MFVLTHWSVSFGVGVTGKGISVSVIHAGARGAARLHGPAYHLGLSILHSTCLLCLRWLLPSRHRGGYNLEVFTIIQKHTMPVIDVNPIVSTRRVLHPRLRCWSPRNLALRSLLCKGFCFHLVSWSSQCLLDVQPASMLLWRRLPDRIHHLCHCGDVNRHLHRYFLLGAALLIISITDKLGPCLQFTCFTYKTKCGVRSSHSWKIKIFIELLVFIEFHVVTSFVSSSMATHPRPSEGFIFCMG